MLLPSSLRGFQPAGNSPTFARPKSSISLHSSSAGITGGATSVTGSATAMASSTPIRNWRITLRLGNREAISGPGATSGRRGCRRPRRAGRSCGTRARDHPAEAFLKAPDELQHEPRGVAHGVRDVADGDELGLVAVAPLEEDLHRHAAVRHALAHRPPRVEPAPLLLPLAQRERVLDLARQPRHDVLHLRDLLGRQREQRLVREHLARELLALAVGAALQLALDVLADHPVEGLQPQLEVVADARELAGIEAPGLQHPHDLLDVALDRGPVELVRDLPREVADLEEVHQPLEAGVLAARADGHLHFAPLAAHQQLGEIVQLEAFLVDETIQQLLHARVLGAEGFLDPLAEGLEVEEIEVEDAVEGRQVARFLDEGGGQRGLERLAVGQADLRAGRERVERLRGRDAQLGPAQVADELEDSLVHVTPYGARTLSSAPLTRSRSFSYFTSIVSVDSTSAGSSACALRMTSERAQSSDSDTEGGLRSSSARIFCTAATTAEASLAGISGTLSRMISSSSAGAGKSMKRCRQRRLSPSDSSRALFDVSTTSGMCLALTVPSSGTETWKSESTSSRNASNSGSALSISSMSSTTGVSDWIAASSGRCDRKR